MRHSLSGIGICEAALRFGDAVEAAECASEIESLGYSAAWIPVIGGDVFGAMQSLLATTNELTIATGILNLWMHEASDCASRFNQFTETDASRVVVGIGTSHAAYVDDGKDRHYGRPLTRMREFLDELDMSTPGLPSNTRVLAALGPKM